ncbi:UNVERIFIED_CONTAM: hypothetical protein K2H54_009376 [Gekko kuhli]
MAAGLEKVPLASEELAQQCPTPPAYSAVMAKPSSTGRLLRIGAMALIGGALLLLFGAIGAFYYWKASDKELYNVHYTMSINGKVQEASMEIDAGNNLEIFKTGSGGEEAIEVHDFQIGITGIRFAGGEKCYIKAQAKTRVPEVNAMTKESLSFDLEDEILPAKFDENSLVWVAADQPIKNSHFLSPRILELCGDLQIFWLRPSYPKVGQRRKRGATRRRRQTETNFDLDQFEAAAEEANSRPRSQQRAREPERLSNNTRPSERDVRPTFNPDNPYHAMAGHEPEVPARRLASERIVLEVTCDNPEQELRWENGAGPSQALRVALCAVVAAQLFPKKLSLEKSSLSHKRSGSHSAPNPVLIQLLLGVYQLEGEGMTFDPRLDHEGVCCIECRRSYTHCQRICEPLLGYYPWPYNYQGCRSACRLIMPCSWWVARILGVV